MRACIGIGANLGDAIGVVRKAIGDLGSLPATSLVAKSSLYRTAPIGHVDQPPFTNAVAMLDTRLAPHALLAALQRLEAEAGRERSFRDAPRTLDLDLLLVDDLVITTPDLVVPHPRMHERAFVLAPLTEIDPRVVVPGHGEAAMLLARIVDQSVERIGPG